MPRQERSFAFLSYDPPKFSFQEGSASIKKGGREPLCKKYTIALHISVTVALIFSKRPAIAAPKHRKTSANGPFVRPFSEGIIGLLLHIAPLSKYADSIVKEGVFVNSFCKKKPQFFEKNHGFCRFNCRFQLHLKDRCLSFPSFRLPFPRKPRRLLLHFAGRFLLLSFLRAFQAGS